MGKLIFLGIFVTFLACGGGGGESKEAMPIMAKESEVINEEIPAERQGKALAQEQSQQQIIKTASLSFETVDPFKTHQKILDLVSLNKGFIATDNSGKDYSRTYRNMVVRVPTKNFQSLINGISEGVTYFDQKAISRQDITEEFIDIEARLKAKRELEKRYLELLSQAKNVKEMLDIERELSSIREEIEAKQGRLKYLQDRVSTSTITIEFYKYTAETGVTQSYGQKMKNALQGGWNGISVFFLGLLYLWPLAIVIILGVIVIRWLIKRNKKNNI